MTSVPVLLSMLGNWPWVQRSEDLFPVYRVSKRQSRDVTIRHPSSARDSQSLYSSASSNRAQDMSVPRAQGLLSQELSKSEPLSKSLSVLLSSSSPPGPPLTPVLSSVPRSFFPVAFGFLGSASNISFLSAVSRGNLGVAVESGVGEHSELPKVPS